MTIPDGKTGFLVQSAHGGEATATYVIDGSDLLASTRMPDDKSPSTVVALASPAGGGPRDVTVATMAEINSSYPVELTVTSNGGGVAGADGTLGPKITNVTQTA